MGLDSCMKCIKYTLFIFNFIFWLIGVLLLGFGLYVLINPMINKGFFEDASLNDAVHKLSLALVILGSIVMLLGFLGCCGAILENKCMLIVFFILMTIIFLCLVAVGLLVVFWKSAVINSTTEAFGKEMKNRTDNYNRPRGQADQNKTNEMDAYQKFAKCCGDQGPSDYKIIPDSCKDDAGIVYPKGCTKKLEEELLKYWLKAIIAVFTTAFITLIGMIFSMLLCCALRDEYD